eukprot:scaffold32_cov144-Skeletonema_menzelii.AAC.2
MEDRRKPSDRQGIVPHANRGRSLTTKKLSTRSRTSSKRRDHNHGERVDTRGRSHSICRKKIQAPAVSAEDKQKLSRSKSCSRHRSKSRTTPQRWSSSATYRSSARGDARSQSRGRKKSELRTAKSAADVTQVVRHSCIVPRSRSMSRNRTETPIQGSAAALSSALSTQQDKSSDKAKVTASSSRRFVIEVDENMNILKLNEVNESDKPVLDNAMYQKSRRRSSSFDGKQSIRTEYRQNRRRSSSCEPPLTRSSALRSSNERLSIVSRSRSWLNQSQSVTFSIHDEKPEDIIKRVSSYSRQVPQIRDVDFDPDYLESDLQAASTIDDDEEDAFVKPSTSWGIPSVSGDANNSNLFSGVDSNLSVVASANGAVHFDQAGSNVPDETNTLSRRTFFRKKSIRRTVPVNTYSEGSDREEKETSLLMTGAASCLEAHQQKTKQKSGRRSRLYKMINKYQ